MPVRILLEDHWGINPNELMMLAGWPALKAFDIHTENGVLPRSGRYGEGDREDSEPGHEENRGGGDMVLVRQYFEEEQYIPKYET